MVYPDNNGYIWLYDYKICPFLQLMYGYMFYILLILWLYDVISCYRIPSIINSCSNALPKLGLNLLPRSSRGMVWGWFILLWCHVRKKKIPTHC